MPDKILSLVRLRPAVKEDCKHIWKWRSQSTSRKGSFNSQELDHQEHERWFLAKSADPRTRIFIVTNLRGREVGYVRLDIMNQEAEMSIAIDDSQTGKGYGTAAIRAGADHALAIEHVSCVVARVRGDNPASIAAFSRAGFALRRHVRIGSIEACEMMRGTNG